MTEVLAVRATVGDHLRQWRERRRLSQLDLATEAAISTRHLSYIETGRSRPSREMILRLADELDISPRDRNVLLVAAGFAPVFPERALGAPEMTAIRDAVDLILSSHAPNPAYALDRHWNIVASNGAFPEALTGVDETLLKAPVNLMRLTLHPRGLASRIVNHAVWAGWLLVKLERQISLTADPVLCALLEELRGYAPAGARRPSVEASREVVVPFQLRQGESVLSFLTTTLVFGTAQDVLLSELSLETLYPADASTQAWIWGRGGAQSVRQDGGGGHPRTKA